MKWLFFIALIVGLLACSLDNESLHVNYIEYPSDFRAQVAGYWVSTDGDSLIFSLEQSYLIYNSVKHYYTIDDDKLLIKAYIDYYYGTESFDLVLFSFPLISEKELITIFQGIGKHQIWQRPVFLDRNVAIEELIF